MYVITLFLKLREGIMFHSRAFLLALVFCFQAGRKKIVESLAVLRAHRLNVARRHRRAPDRLPYLVGPVK